MQIRRSTATRISTQSNNVPNSTVEPLILNEVAIHFNENSLEQCRICVSVLSGCVAGILGLTSYKGFLFYALSMFLLSCLISLYIRFDYGKFFRHGRHVFVNGFFNGLLTFFLFWTFLYGMIHVY